MPQPSNLPLRPVSTPRMFESVCDQIRQQIDTGALKPGDKLPSERDLAQELNVSRPVMREALRALEMTGVISMHKGATGGAVIREHDHGARIADEMRRALGVQFGSSAALLEAYRAVFGAAVALTTERASQEDLARIVSSSDAIDQASGVEEQSNAARKMIQTIAAASGNPVLSSLADALAVARWRVQAPAREASSPELQRDRNSLVQAIGSGNASTAKVEADRFVTRYAEQAAAGLSRPEH